ncbi:MAG: enoyl-CoA hydratase/isomerase family protein [Polaromonas sp.]|jgi:methylglutaconyl-CoA hydratase|nr:enoyl-CoA hydratase/isomerase family protein [Polaromonas sp.]
MNYTTIEIESRNACAWVWMNRPDKHNAFDELLIGELTTALTALDTDLSIRAVVLGGRGKSFSAGADLNWMKRQGEASADDNLMDARRLAELFRVLAYMSKPTIARVHGAAMGGGMGLAAACDICIASAQATFATSEVKLGIVPAVISPYVVRAIGERHSYRYFQTAERITAVRAREIGLAHEVTEPDQLDAQVQSVVGALLAGGPLAQAAATDMIRAVANRPVTPTLIEDTAQRIAHLRSTPEAKEGLSAFLEKRTPQWMMTNANSHV